MITLHPILSMGRAGASSMTAYRDDEEPRRERERDQADARRSDLAFEEAIRAAQSKRLARPFENRKYPWRAVLAGSLGAGFGFFFTAQISMAVVGATLGAGGALLLRLIDELPPHGKPPSSNRCAARRLRQRIFFAP